MSFDVHTHQTHENSILNTYPLSKTPSQWFSVGIHPWFLDNLEAQKVALIAKVQEDNCLAIGEFGFDRVCGTSLELQQEVFGFQYSLANQFRKPIIVHCVKAFDLLLPRIKESNVPIILHGFNQNAEILNQVLKGERIYFSFGKALLKENSNAQKAIKQLPIDRFFLETDDQQEISIKDIYIKTAELLNLPLDGLSNQIIKNKIKVFS